MIDKAYPMEIAMLNRKMVVENLRLFGLKRHLFELPERIIQFGIGGVLRGLVDFLVDKANREYCFNGRVVVVKPTRDDVFDFREQDNLYTLLEKGFSGGVEIERKLIISCISRALAACKDWEEILKCAEDPSIGIVVSNTTDLGLVYRTERPGETPPASFPGKLAHYLWRRYTAFDGDATKGMVVLPTEGIADNGDVLKELVLRHAFAMRLPTCFIDWINSCNSFCNTFVDRVVPGKYAVDDTIEWNGRFRYVDHLHMEAEPFFLWAIQGSADVIKRLSFAAADDRVMIEESIDAFREQKLRIVQGRNVLVATAAFLSGCHELLDTVTDPLFAEYTRRVIFNEIIPTIQDQCPHAAVFAGQLLERLRNKHVQYPLLNECQQCSSKMNKSNGVTTLRYYERFGRFPELITIGMAAFFVFYSPSGRDEGGYYGLSDVMKYRFRDDHAEFICSTLEGVDWVTGVGAVNAIQAILGNSDIFSPELAALPGWSKVIAGWCGALKKDGVRKTLLNYFDENFEDLFDLR